MAKNKNSWSKEDQDNYEIVSEYLDDTTALYEDDDTLDEGRLILRAKLTIRNIFIAIFVLIISIMIVGGYQTTTYGTTYDGEYILVTSEVRNRKIFLQERVAYVELIIEVETQLENYFNVNNQAQYKTEISRIALYDEWIKAIENYNSGLTYDGTKELTEPNTEELRAFEMKLRYILTGGDHSEYTLYNALRHEAESGSLSDGYYPRESNGLLSITNNVIRIIREERNFFNRIMEEGGVQ